MKERGSLAPTPPEADPNTKRSFNSRGGGVKNRLGKDRGGIEGKHDFRRTSSTSPKEGGPEVLRKATRSKEGSVASVAA